MSARCINQGNLRSFELLFNVVHFFLFIFSLLLDFVNTWIIITFLVENRGKLHREEKKGVKNKKQERKNGKKFSLLLYDVIRGKGYMRIFARLTIYPYESFLLLLTALSTFSTSETGFTSTVSSSSFFKKLSYIVFAPFLSGWNK